MIDDSDLPDFLRDDEPDDEWPDYVLRPDWYEYNDVLRRTRDWARLALIPPDLLLVDVLAEVLLRAPVAVRLPGRVIGGPGALNFGAVVVAETGVGKSTGRMLLREILGDRPVADRVWPLGTGEGLTESLLGAAPAKGEERVPHGEPVLVISDEGRELDALASRTGSTLLSTLCSAISGSALGQGNATSTTRRIVPAHSYRLAVRLAIQPALLAGPLADFDSGLPQRFLFVSGTGHALETARLPAEDPVKIFLPEAPFSHRSPWVDMPTPIRDEIRLAHLDRLRALDVGEPVAADSHRNSSATACTAVLMFSTVW